MSTGKKVVLFIYIIVITLICIGLLCSIFGVLKTSYIQDVANMMTGTEFGYKVLFTIILCVFIAVGIFLLFFDVKKAPEKTVKIAAVDSGTVFITIKAVHELISKYLSKEKSVKEGQTKIVVNDDNIDINVGVSVYPGISIPDVTRSISTGLKESIESQTGINVNNVNVLVQNILNAHHNNSKVGSGVVVK